MKHRKLRKWREFPPEVAGVKEPTLAPVDIWQGGSGWWYGRRAWHAGDRQWVALDVAKCAVSLEKAKAAVNTMGREPRFNFGDFLEMAE